MISIIIPLKQDQGYLKNCIEACLKQKDSEIEVIVLPDESLPWKDSRIIQEPTGPVSPASKRNRGVQLSRGEILAFIDDDTRPREDWLEAALKHFTDPQIAAVGGPSITPLNDPFWAQVSGAVYESWMMSGKERRRYQPTTACDVQDFPSCNLLVRHSAFETVGGFGTDFWPGEDTEFCLALIKKGFRIRYEPNTIIEHHRRFSFLKHLKQLGNYGLHRGYFAKRYPETSRRLIYFLPLLMIIAGITLTAYTFLGNLLAKRTLETLIILYFILVFISFSRKSLLVRLFATTTLLFSHLTYGIAFLYGLLAPRLCEEKR